MAEHPSRRRLMGALRRGQRRCATRSATAPRARPCDDEEQRLIAQAQVLEPITERALQEAGIGPGMRVLDLGSGAGDVALLAGHLVGPEGSVLGVERSGETVERARRRAAREGYVNVEFVHGDLTDLNAVLGGAEPGFDAVVGRAILMYLSDPVSVLRTAVNHVRSGGVLCFSELDLTFAGAAFPASPLWDQVRAWVRDILAAVGANERMGLELHRTFRSAGLPAPQLRLDTVVGSGADAPWPTWVNVIRAGLPVLEKAGVAASMVDPDTLGQRLTAETEANDGIVLLPLFVHAWSRKGAESAD